MRNKPSLLYLLFLGIFLFTDPFIFFRVLFGNDVLVIIAICIVFAYLLIYNYFNLLYRIKIDNPGKLLVFLAVFSIWSLLIRIYANVNATDILIYLRFIVSLFFLLYCFKFENMSLILIRSYVIAGILHMITVIPIFGFIQERLGQYTAYEMGEYAIGIFTKRSTGFFPAPGYLVLYATGLMMIGLNKVRTTKIGWLLIILASFLGLATLNRSFLIVFALSFILIAFKLKKTVSNNVIWIFPLIILFFIFFADSLTAVYDLYSDYINQRFENQSFSDNDRIYGPTGIMEALQAIANYPFFGSAVSVDGAMLQAWNGYMYVTPHNSILLICAFYGLILGIPILGPLLNIWLRSIKLIILKNTNIYFTYLFGAMALMIICMIEPLFETTIFAFFYLGAYLTLWGQKNKNKKIKF